MIKQQTDDEARMKAREAFFDWLFTTMAKRQLAKNQTNIQHISKDAK